MSTQMDPLIVIGPRHDWTKRWCETHVRATERKPITVSDITQLRGVRYKVIVILPEASWHPEHDYILSHNTIIDLR